MGGYEVIIRDAVANILSPQFESMKLNVAHHAWTGSDGNGADTFDPPLTQPGVTRRAIVNLTRKETWIAGVKVITVATLYFLDPIPDNGAPLRQEPIDTRDILTLPNGVTAPIRSVGGQTDSLTSQPFVYKVILGVLG